MTIINYLKKTYKPLTPWRAPTKMSLSESSIDLFELRRPQDLFKEIQIAIIEYDKEPNSRLLLFLLFSLNHLRDWIAEKNRETLEQKRLTCPLLPNEEFYFKLWELEEFRVINSLCNRSKHHHVKRGVKTSVTQGMRCNSSCSDSLGQIYYRIDDIDSMAIFLPVIRQYYEWFHRAD